MSAIGSRYLPCSLTKEAPFPPTISISTRVANAMAHTNPNATEGEVSFDVPAAGKPCKTWYKIYGNLSSSSTGRPLVALHGGPGACHNYLLPLADLAAAPHSIP